MKLALDSDRYSDFRRGLADVVDTIQLAAEVIIPFIVVGELRAGFRLGRRTGENETSLADFLRERRVRIAWADDLTTRVYGEVLAGLRRAGTPIPTNNVWIAAICIQNGIPIFSRDQHFDKVPRLARI